MKFILPGPDVVRRAEKDIRTGNLPMLLVLPVAVTFMPGLFGGSVDRTMDILGFRHEHATVYIRGTWSSYWRDKRSTDRMHSWHPMTPGMIMLPCR